jgi:glycine cleavage system aminomethyltransferase T
MAFEKVLDELGKRKARALAMGGEEKLARRKAEGVLNARERIDALLDAGTFVESGLYATSHRPEVKDRSPADAKIAGFGRIDKRPVALVSNDFTVLDAEVAAKFPAQADGWRKLVGLVMAERGIPREGYPVYAGDRLVGSVTSGTMSPTLKRGIALALVETPCAVLGADLLVGIRDRKLRAKIVKPPFVKK